jgi:hypothetical protein
MRRIIVVATSLVLAVGLVIGDPLCLRGGVAASISG